MIFMQSFQWTGEMAIFQPEFDAEHRELLRLCEELQRAVQAGAESAAVTETMRRLTAEVEAHFSHEEREMRSKRLAGYAWHKQQHDNARRKLAAMAETAPADVPAFLADWVHTHAGVADRIMAARLRNACRLSPRRRCGNATGGRVRQAAS